MAPKFLVALTLLLAAGMILSADAKCADSNCKRCPNTARCDLCKDGYTVVGFSCVKCADPNCNQCESPYSCKVCNKHYSLEKAVCVPWGDSVSTVAPVAIAGTVLAASLIAVVA